MPYQYLDDIAPSDAAFVAMGESLADVFRAAVDATLNVMVDDIASVMPRVKKEFSAQDDSYDLALVQLLQEIIYYKDAQQLLLRVVVLSVAKKEGRVLVSATLAGEPIDRARHQLGVDVKAVTMHRLSVDKTPIGWKATVVLDI